MNQTLTRDGTQGRVYGGDPNLIHVKDGKRRDFGDMLADVVDMHMRYGPLGAGDTKARERAFKKLCPGCYMIVMFNALITLAERNGQPLSELAATMAAAFETLIGEEDYSKAYTEEIEVLLDPE